MLFGSKDSFAIEIEINNFFHNKHVGEGKFIVYLKNEIYGVNKEFATTFLCIKDELYNFYKNFINSDIELCSYSSIEIAKSYYLQNYSDIDISYLNSDLLKRTKHLISWSPESAFDDGSFVMHFNNNEKTRIIGFKSYMENEICMVKETSIIEVIINYNEFLEVIKDAYNYLILKY